MLGFPIRNTTRRCARSSAILQSTCVIYKCMLRRYRKSVKHGKRAPQHHFRARLLTLRTLNILATRFSSVLHRIPIQPESQYGLWLFEHSPSFRITIRPHYGLPALRAAERTLIVSAPISVFIFVLASTSIYIL